MSLPNYIVNLEEFVESVLKAYYNARLYKGGEQKVKGILVEEKGRGEYTHSWQTTEEISLSSIDFTPEDIRNIGYRDSWDLFINGKKIYDTVYVKEMSERKSFNEPYKVDKNSEIEIRVRREYDSPMTYMWDINYSVLKLIGVVVIVCVDENTNSIIYHEGLIYPPEGTFYVSAPEIEGYNTNMGEKEVVFTQGKETQLVYFYYSEVT